MSAEPRICHRCEYCPASPEEETCPNDGSHLIAVSQHDRYPRDGFLGSTLGGRYPVLGIIGAGGMGAVYRSVQPIIGREVAIKVILPNHGFAAEEARERFLREAQIVAQLDHPAVVTLYDFGVEKDGT